MFNITLTIAAAPELLAALSSLTNSITSAMVVTVPQATQKYTSSKAALEQIDAVSDYNQSTSNSNIYGAHEPVTQQPTPVPVSMVQVAAQTPAVQTAAVPTSTQSYTTEQLAIAATQLVDAGRRTELVSLLQTFGVQALTALPKEQYGAFATKLRGLGAKI